MWTPPHHYRTHMYLLNISFQIFPLSSTVLGKPPTRVSSGRMCVHSATRASVRRWGGLSVPLHPKRSSGQGFFPILASHIFIALGIVAREQVWAAWFRRKATTARFQSCSSTLGKDHVGVLRSGVHKLVAL